MSNLLFFFDEDLPARSRNVHFVYGPVERLGILMHGDTLADKGAASIFLSKTYQLPDDSYRMYYWSYGSRCGEDPNESIPQALIATSTDRLHWEKPDLGQVKINGKGTNILHIEGLDRQIKAAPCQLRLADDHWRMYFWGCENQTNLWSCMVADSEDGLHWKLINDGQAVLYHPPVREAGPLLCEVAKNLHKDPVEYERTEELRLRRLLSNDGASFHGNERDGFEVFHPYILVQNPDWGREVELKGDAICWLRTIARRTSSDGICWSDPEILIWPDAKDPWDLQFYMLPQCNYAGWRIGFLGHYRTERGQDDLFIELAFSRDGRRWSRPLRGPWFLGGDEYAYEGQGPGGDGLIDMGDHWLFYYTGAGWPHDDYDPDDFRQTIMAVRLPKNRLLGVAADKVVGEFITEPIFLSEDEIKIDANIRGWLRAELCDIFGRKHEGYHLMDSEPVSGDNQDHVLRWKGKDSAEFRYKPVRIRFEFAEGEVFCVKY
jgi:hypothetical protein